jgi:hypothetical protein
MRHFDPWSLFPILKDVALALVPAAAAVWAWLRARRAQSWPSAQGTIVGTSVRPARQGGYFHPWVAEMAYSYVVDGEYYSGSHNIHARSERRAEEKVGGWKNRMVVVRYSPNKHDVSVLLKSDQPGGQLGN